LLPNLRAQVMPIQGKRLRLIDNPRIILITFNLDHVGY
jgi:hypothetical protein